ncbi:MAG: hypothetical protein HKN13_05990 [Rhodothermales bacterium]|nr:hypothetical protein [Rhodothermales bacterium]
MRSTILYLGFPNGRGECNWHGGQMPKRASTAKSMPELPGIMILMDDAMPPASAD